MGLGMLPSRMMRFLVLASGSVEGMEDSTKNRIILEGNIPSPIKPPAGCKFHTRCYMACDKCKQETPPLRELEPGHFVACHFAESMPEYIANMKKQNEAK